MVNKKIYFDSIIRLAGSLSLVIGVLFGLPGFENRTAASIFLWLSVLIGITGVVASFFGRRSWYGAVIVLAAYLFMIIRLFPNRSIQFVVTVCVLSIGFGGLADNLVTKNYTKLFIKKKK